MLGIDPGSRVTGWGFVVGNRWRIESADYGCLRSPRAAARAALLAVLAEGLRQLLDRFAPDVVAIETPFTARFARAALGLAETRGALLATLGRWGGPVAEYQPALVKAAIVGFGRAEKHQVAYVVQRMLGLTRAPASDSADALAIALCHLRHGNLDAARGPVLASRPVDTV